MSEHTLLVVLVTVLAASWLVVAAVVGAIGWQVIKILQEVRTLTAHLRSVGKAAIEDVELLRARIRAEGSKLWHIVDFVVGMATRNITTPRSRKKPAKKVKIKVEEHE